MTRSLDYEHRAPVYRDSVTELCGALLAMLPRSDQRRAAEFYVQALVSVEGRKSIRNIASIIGSSAAEQRLHHFIGKSTWDWRPVRRALVHYLRERSPATAWVLQPIIVEKAGEHSVGVKNHVVQCLGRSINHQHVLALWHTSDAVSCPVDWRLVLTERWLSDRSRRTKAGIPEHVDSSTPTESALSMVRGLLSTVGPLDRPVVMDARDVDSAAVVAFLARHRIPFLLRVRGGTPVVGTDPAGPRLGAQPLPAQRLAGMVKGLRRSVPWPDGSTREALALRVEPAFPAEGAGGHPLLMMAEWDGPDPAPRVWLTNLHDAGLGTLLRLARLIKHVDRDFRQVSMGVGAMDFEGRSFVGWHHHKTLVSMAHAVVALCSSTGGAPPRLASMPEADCTAVLSRG